MNKLFLLTLLSFSLYAQSAMDTLVYTTGIKTPGKYIKLNKKVIFFQLEGQDAPWEIKKGTIDSVLSKKLFGRSYFIDLVSGEEELTDYGKKFAPQFEAEMMAIEMERRSKVNYLILPLKNDKFARTEEYIKSLEDSGFNVIANYYALEYFSKNKIPYNEINDYEIIKMAEFLKIDKVIFGDLYIIKEDFAYSPDLKAATDYQLIQEAQQTPSPSSSTYNLSSSKYNFDIKRQPSQIGDIDNAWQNYSAVNNINEDEKNRLSAEEKAGTYLYETIYEIDIANKRRIYVKENEIVKKW